MFSAAERTTRPEAESASALKQRLGISDYISLSGPKSLYQLVKEGAISVAGNYILDKTKANELIGSMNDTASKLLNVHAQIQQLGGTAAENAKSHWTKLAYRQQQIVKAINESAQKTDKIFGGVAAERVQRLAATRELGAAPFLVAGVAVAIVGVLGILVLVGAVVTSAIRHHAEVDMYEKDIQTTLATGKATGMVAARAEKDDPILGDLSKFFGRINWKAILGVGLVGAGCLLGYYYLKTRIIGRQQQPALSGRGPDGRYHIPKVKGSFPRDLLHD